jgi:alanine racemase
VNPKEFEYKSTIAGPYHHIQYIIAHISRAEQKVQETDTQHQERTSKEQRFEVASLHASLSGLSSGHHGSCLCGCEPADASSILGLRLGKYRVGNIGEL